MIVLPPRLALTTEAPTFMCFENGVLCMIRSIREIGVPLGEARASDHKAVRLFELSGCFIHGIVVKHTLPGFLAGIAGHAASDGLVPDMDINAFSLKDADHFFGALADQPSARGLPFSKRTFAIFIFSLSFDFVYIILRSGEKESTHF